MRPDAEDLAVVRAAWNNRCAKYGIQDARLNAIDPVLDAYASADRHYHNLRHIASCLQELASLPGPIPNRPPIETALLFHDCVYDARRSDNEERSALEATERLRAIEEPPAFIDDVQRLILATRHKAAPSLPDEQVIVDIDLSILGQGTDLFDVYERAIRLEYSHVPDETFRMGRMKVLEEFLGRSTIYTTLVMRERYEVMARQNLQRSIASLRMLSL